MCKVNKESRGNNNALHKQLEILKIKDLYKIELAKRIFIHSRITYYHLFSVITFNLLRFQHVKLYLPIVF